MRRSSLLAAVLSAAAFSPGCEAPPEESGPDTTTQQPALDPWVHELKGRVNPSELASGPDGDLFLGGYFFDEIDFGGGALWAQENGSVFLAHLDAAGGHLMSGATGSNDEVTSVAVGQDGSLFATGTIDGAMSFGSGDLYGTKDGYLTAFSPAGEPRFSRQVNGTAQVWLQRVAATPQGNVVIAGLIDQSTDLGKGPDGESAAPEILVAEYGPSGELLWTVRLPNSPVYEVAMTVDRDGNVYVATGVFGAVDFAGTTVDYGTFVAKIGADGTPRWLAAASHEDGYLPSVHDLATDEDGNVYMSGFYYYYGFTIGGVSVPPSQQLNGYVAKLSPEGKGLYAKAFVLNTYSNGNLEIAAAPGGDLLVALSVQGAVDFGGGILGAPSNENHTLVARFGPSGEHLESMEVGGTGSRYAWDIAADPKGHLVILGAFDSMLDLEGQHLETGAGFNWTAYLARTSF